MLCWMTALHSRGISGKSPPTAGRFRSLDALDSLKTNSDEHSSAFHSQGQKQKELWKDISCTNSIAKVRGQGFPSGSGSSSSTEAGVGTNRAKQQSCTQDRDWKLGVVGTASVVRRQITHSLTPLTFHCSALEADYSMAPQDWYIILYFACENNKKPSRQDIC